MAQSKTNRSKQSTARCHTNWYNNNSHWHEITSRAKHLHSWKRKTNQISKHWHRNTEEQTWHALSVEWRKEKAKDRQLDECSHVWACNSSNNNDTRSWYCALWLRCSLRCTVNININIPLIKKNISCMTTNIPSTQTYTIKFSGTINPDQSFFRKKIVFRAERSSWLVGIFLRLTGDAFRLESYNERSPEELALMEEQEWNYLRKMGMFLLPYPGQPDIEHPFVTRTTRQTDYSCIGCKYSRE